MMHLRFLILVSICLSSFIHASDSSQGCWVGKYSFAREDNSIREKQLSLRFPTETVHGSVRMGFTRDPSPISACDWNDDKTKATIQFVLETENDEDELFFLHITLAGNGNYIGTMEDSEKVVANISLTWQPDATMPDAVKKDSNSSWVFIQEE